MHKHRITFSTLGCPEWPLEMVVAKAAQFGYDGIEWRGGPEGHANPSMPASRRARLAQRMAEAGLATVAVTTYTSFVSDDPTERQANVDDLRRHLDLAGELGADFARVFVGDLAPGVAPADVYDRVVDCLEKAVGHAKGVGVGLAIEPHDDFVRPHTVVPILERLTDPIVGVVWDIANTYAAGDHVADSFNLLGRRVFYVHVKDGVGRGPQWRLTPVGKGEVPLEEAFWRLITIGYAGPFSVEWERAWHPELDPPEVALPAALRAVRDLLATAQEHC